MNRISLNAIGHAYGEKKVLENFSMTLDPGTVTCLFGPSGSGKTTVLNILAGIMKPGSGALSEEPYTVSCVFQDLRLLPWRTVAGNLSFVMKGQVPQESLDTRIEAALRLVELWDERHSWPHQLSGGMKQRVALARALAMPADLLLMDEPFKGFDIALRQRIMERCRAKWQEEGQTVLLVTHDPIEAEFLAGKVVGINAED